jgi:hypothetical protein
MYQRGTFFVTGLFRFAFVLSSVCRVFVLLRLHHQQDCADAVGRWERGCRDWVGDWAGSGPADWEGDVLAAKRKARLLAFSDACTEQVRKRNLSSGPFVYQKWSFYRDRLGTNVGKAALINMRAFSSRRRRRTRT